MTATVRTCCICDKELSKSYLDFLKKNSAIASYIDVCQDHAHLKYSFDIHKAPGENLGHLKHLRVEYGNDSAIEVSKLVIDEKEKEVIFNPTEFTDELFPPENPSLPTTGIVVDGSCSPNPGGICEWKCFSLDDKRIIFKSKTYFGGTNNIAEFLGLVHALAHCEKMNLSFDIYSDSATAISWVKKKKCSTTYPRSTGNSELYNLINRAEKWLRENEYKNKVIQWNTKTWGENTADYGRK